MHPSGYIESRQAEVTRETPMETRRSQLSHRRKEKSQRYQLDERGARSSRRHYETPGVVGIKAGINDPTVTSEANLSKTCETVRINVKWREIETD